MLSLSANIPLLSSLLLLSQAMSQITVPAECGDVQASELTRQLITDDLSNPVEMAVAPDGRIFVVEKNTGDIKIVEDGNVSTAGHVDVYTPAHAGLIGLALDPDFADNHFVYVYYTHETEAKHELARFTEANGTLADATKVVMLVNPCVRWNDQHHSAGSLAFGPEGNLYLARGENVNPKVSGGYASVDESDRLKDTQATSANTNDYQMKLEMTND